MSDTSDLMAGELTLRELDIKKGIATILATNRRTQRVHPISMLFSLKQITI